MTPSVPNSPRQVFAPFLSHFPVNDSQLLQASLLLIKFSSKVATQWVKNCKSLKGAIRISRASGTCMLMGRYRKTTVTEDCDWGSRDRSIPSCRCLFPLFPTPLLGSRSFLSCTLLGSCSFLSVHDAAVSLQLLLRHIRITPAAPGNQLQLELA